MSAHVGDVVAGAACPKKYGCVPYAKGCSGEYCRECRRQGYLYYFNKKWEKNGSVLKPKSFNESRSHAPIRDAGGVTFGWGNPDDWDN